MDKPCGMLITLNWLRLDAADFLAFASDRCYSVPMLAVMVLQAHWTGVYEGVALDLIHFNISLIVLNA
jgi:hypothetical protein